MKKSGIMGFDTGFYKDGNRIEFLLDEKMLGKSNLKLYKLADDDLKQLENELTDSSLLFFTDGLTGFYITKENKNKCTLDRIWYRCRNYNSNSCMAWDFVFALKKDQASNSKRSYMQFVF